ncbi:MAG: hypothetical protein V1776_04630 [Candidatus Diapherotrites archaeon]
MNPSRIAFLYTLLLITSPLASALPSTENSSFPNENLPPIATPIPLIENNPPSDILITFQATPTGGVCRISQLDPEEVQRLKDAILTPGLVGNEISAGTPPNNNRDTVSDTNKLLIPNPYDTESAYQKQVPVELLSPEELSPLQNNRIKGPFAFGISLYDSLRAARCVNDETCAVLGEQLQLRNSGEGISGNIKDMWNAVTKDLDSPSSTFTEEESATIRAQIQSEQLLEDEDSNSVPVQFYSRATSPDAMNHIRADNTWQSGMLTNCDDGKCILTLYSMFDKYFNSWYSGDLVIGSFGPTVWGQFRKMLVNSKRFNLVSGKLADKLNLANVWSGKKITSAGIFAGGAPVGPNDFFSRMKSLDKATGSKGFYEISGADYFRNLKKTAQRDTDLGKMYEEMFIQAKITSTGKVSGIEDELFKEDGILGKVTSFEKRKKVFAYTGKLKQHADITEAIRLELEKLAKSGNPAERIQAARGYARIFKDTDDAFNLDLKKMFKELPEADFRKIYVKDPNTGATRSLLDFDDKYFNQMYDSFVKHGDFRDVTILERDAATGALKLFRVQPVSNPIGTIDMVRLQNGGYPDDALVRLFSGENVAATPRNHDIILKDQLANAGQVQYVYAGGFIPSNEQFSPNALAEKILAGNIMDGKVKSYSQNMNSIYDTMVARDWGKGTYTNLLSKGLQSNENLISKYFKIWDPHVLQSGIGTTGKMYLYWAFARGFGFDDFSIYQLPDEWTEVQFEPGETEFYNDAYIDIFANEGSDTGDIFQKVISNLPIPYVLDKFVGEFDTLDTVWNWVNGGMARTNPDNLAMFMFGSPSCPECSASLVSPANERFDVQYVSPESMNGFFIEHAQTKEATEEGQLLITYSHHADIKGRMQGEPLDEINLVKARQEEETCQQVMEDIPFYGSAAKLFGAETTGAAAAVVENLFYVGAGFFGVGLMGVFFSLANQAAIAPQMGECVDDKEGYFASLFVPKPKEKEGKTTELEKNISEKALDGIREFTNTIDSNHSNPSLSEKVLQESTSKVRELIDDAQKNDVAEAELRITGSSSGYLRAEEVMYFWGGGESLIEPTKYNTDGKTVIGTEDGHTITLDNDKGTLSVDGQIVIDEEHADHERLSNKNLAIPAVEIPQRLNGYTLGIDANSLLFNVNIRGEAVVHDVELLDCIQSAILAQSGVPLNSNNISEAFGKTDSIVTDVYPSISFDTIHNRILLGGQVPQNANGGNASVSVYGDRHVIVNGAPNPLAGNFQSGLWENGSIIYKPQTNELLIWLRHHAQAVVSDQDVKGFDGKLTTLNNPLTFCEEPAIDLSVETDPATAGTKLKGDNLTAGLQKNGPFQVFETENKRFILYSKLVDGECKDYFRVVNKDTGEVYDQEITGISQNEDGTINIATADGQKHTLEFSDQNGKPVITYDGQSALLRSASGPGGSFYYDPSKGLYYAENAQFVPLNEGFKNQGVSFQANPDGSVTGKPGDNVFVINPAQGGEGLFNIPSLPEEAGGLIVMLLVLMGIIVGIYVDAEERKKKDHSGR